MYAPQTNCLPLYSHMATRAAAAAWTVKHGSLRPVRRSRAALHRTQCNRSCGDNICSLGTSLICKWSAWWLSVEWYGRSRWTKSVDSVPNVICVSNESHPSRPMYGGCGQWTVDSKHDGRFDSQYLVSISSLLRPASGPRPARTSPLPSHFVPPRCLYFRSLVRPAVVPSPRRHAVPLTSPRSCSQLAALCPLVR